MVEIITQITSAEEQSDEIRRAARLQVRSLKDEGTAAGKQHLEDEAQKAAAKAAQIVREAENQARAFLEESAAKSAGECEQLSADAEKKLPKASAFIVERIVASL